MACLGSASVTYLGYMCFTEAPQRGSFYDLVWPNHRSGRKRPHVACNRFFGHSLGRTTSSKESSIPLCLGRCSECNDAAMTAPAWTAL